MSRGKFVNALGVALLFAALSQASAADRAYVDVGKQEPITILTPSTPWLPAFTVLGNVPVWYYRVDALREAGLQPPKTWEDVLASCAKLSKPPATYGATLRADRGNGIRYEWMQWMIGRGGSVVKDPENGDYT